MSNLVNDNKFFYPIKNHDKYVINKLGEIKNIQTNEYLLGSRNPDGYINFRLTDNEGYCKTWGLHRILCFVFKYNDNYEKLVVNHLNGNKSDNNLENLEWCTNTENIYHAGLNKLTNKCKPVSVKNHNTGEIKTFFSFKQCADYFQTTKDAISWRVNKGPGFIFKDGFEYRNCLAHEWLDIDNKLARNRNIAILFLISGKEYVFDTLKEAADFINVSNTTLYNWLQLSGQPVLPGYILVKYYHDKKPWRSIDDFYSELNINKSVKKIKVLSTDGKELIFNSGSECCEYFNIRPTLLSYRLKSQRVTKDGYKFMYFK